MAEERRTSAFSRIVVFSVIFLIAVVVGYFIIRPSQELPIYHPTQLDRRLVDPEVRKAKGEHRIMDFSLTDQQGDELTLADTKGRIIVADFFFTTCPTICPKMSLQMARVQQEFMDDPEVLLLSHSVTPETDTPEVLAEYGELHNADPARWRFLTGDRKQIYELARRSYFAAMDEGDGGPDDFVHTENFVLVDTQRRLRGFYDGTDEKDVDRLINDLGKLLKEERR